MTIAQATHAQHGILVTEQAGVAGTAFHIALTIRFDGPLDVAALRDACAGVAARHAVLSSAVTEVDGTHSFVPGAPLAWTDADLTDVSGDYDTFVAAEIQRPFALDSGPLARFTLLALDHERHVLLVVAHHAAFDGTSKDLLVGELAGRYSAAVSGLPVPATADEPLRYDAHAAAEQAAIATGLSAAKEHFARRWSTPADVVLPGLDRLPTAATTGAELAFIIDGVDAVALDEAARATGVSRFEFVLAGVHALLARYGNTSLPVAVALSTRTETTREHIGCFVNELPVVAPEPVGSFADFARAVRTEVRALNAFRSVPLSHTVHGLRPATALTPVTVSYRRRGDDPKFAAVEATVEWIVHNGAARNALHVQIVDSTPALSVSLQYDVDVLDRAAVARVGAHLRTLLLSAAADPSVDVAGLAVLPAEEEQLLLHRFNATERDFPTLTVPQLLARQVAERPTDVAVVDGERTATYAELDDAVGRLAARLRGRGIRAGSLVAVYLDRSLDALTTLLATMRTGAAYLPVDPAYPGSRRDLVLDDAQPALVVTTAAGAARLPDGTPVLTLDGPDAQPTQGRDTGDDSTPHAVAYVLYTSGSTGRPKGVEISHAALTNLLLSFAGDLGSSPADVWLGLTSLSFDISALELYLPLVTGGRVVMATETHAADGPALRRLVDAHGVTHVQATPSGWRVLLEGDVTGSRLDGGEVTALTGGEALPLPLARELRRHVARLVNVYGPTETTIWSTADEVPAEPNAVTIGRPIANTTVFVLDEQRRLLPIGVPGELYIGGAGLAEGYLRRPELTAERFVPSPFAAGERLYRTGDRVRWLPDGRLDFLGRADNQVKLRGHRIELGEIEAALLEHPAVAQAAVVLRGEADDARIEAFVVARADASPTDVEPAALRAHLGRTLPTVMVPTGWLVLDVLPLTPNGKIDRKALPEVPRQRAAEPSPSVVTDAADAVTETVRAIFCDVLQLDSIDDDEDLFDLGGHSLSITRISSRIAAQLGAQVPLDAFFDTPTVGEISEIVRNIQAVTR